MTENANERDYAPDTTDDQDADTREEGTSLDAAGSPSGLPRDAAAPGDASPNAEARLAEQNDKYLRLAAEFDNFRKRATRERQAAEHHGQGVVIRGLLESLDDLSRFARLDPWKTEVETMTDGARMIEQKLMKALAGHGLEIVDPVGERFDPNHHEAVATAPASSPEEDHLVAEVFQVGYAFNGKLLRPARVVVKQWAR